MYRAFFPVYREIKQDTVIEVLRVAADWAFMWGSDQLRLMPESGETEIHMKGKGLSILQRQSDGSWRFWRALTTCLLRRNQQNSVEQRIPENVLRPHLPAGRLGSPLGLSFAQTIPFGSLSRKETRLTRLRVGVRMLAKTSHSF